MSASVRISEALKLRLAMAAKSRGTTVDKLAEEAILTYLRSLPALSMDQKIRAAYLRATGGGVNEYVKLAALRAELPTEDRATVDAELKAMQRRGEAVLYPIDDPRRLRPGDDAAALKVSGERRDLLLLRRMP